MSKLAEARNLMTEALRVANDVDQDSPELRAGLVRIRDLLDSALKRIDTATDPDPVWPGLAARA